MIDKFTSTGEYVGQITAKTVAAPKASSLACTVSRSIRAVTYGSPRNIRLKVKAVSRADKFSDSIANELQGFATVRRNV